MDAIEALCEGSSLLESVLAPFGFAFRVLGSGDSSGGRFASGVFEHDERRLEFSFRYSLGLVTYSIGGASLSHSEYMRALGHASDASYPGFSSDPLDGFRHLRQDLERFGSEFLTGDETDFERRCEWVASNPAPSGIGAI